MSGLYVSFLPREVSCVHTDMVYIIMFLTFSLCSDSTTEIPAPSCDLTRPVHVGISRTTNLLIRSKRIARELSCMNSRKIGGSSHR